jgi:hypothetical protein
VDTEEANNSDENISVIYLKVLGRESCWWSNDHDSENTAYVKDISSNYAKYKVNNLERLLLVKDESGVEINLFDSNMSLSLNQLYFETLEYMFALYFAFKEAPDAVPLWLNLYRNESLLAACRSLHESHSIQSNESTSNASYNRDIEDILFSAKYGDEREVLSNNRFALIAGLSTILSFSLRYYVKHLNHDTYNQIKHGHRARPNTASIEVALPPSTTVSSVQGSIYLPLIESASGLNFISIKEIRRIASVREYGLRNVSIPVNNRKTVARTHQALTMIDFIIHCMKRRVGVDGCDNQLVLHTPLFYQRAWLADEHEGTIVTDFDYKISEENNTRSRRFYIDFRKNPPQNSGLFSFVNINMHHLISECTRKLGFAVKV